MNIIVNDIKELEKVVDAVTGLLDKGYRLFLLSGDLGSGKTTLVQHVARRLEANDTISSPTFSLVNAYETPKEGVIYHMDFYRLDKPSDLVQIGLEEYLDTGQICFIEWPAVAVDYFSPPLVRVAIDVFPNNIRNFNITTYDAVGT